MKITARKIAGKSTGDPIESFIRGYVQALKDHNAAVFAGAGLSIPAGMVNWQELLKDIATDIGLDVSKEPDLISVAQFHVAIRPRRAIFIEAIEAGSADPAQLHHPFDAQPPVGLHFFLDLPVDRGFPVSACSIRCSSMRCKHPFKKSISTVC